MLGFDWHLRIFASKFNQCDTSIGRQTLSHRIEHLDRIGELVIHIDHQYQIDLANRKLRVVRLTQNHLDIL